MFAGVRGCVLRPASRYNVHGQNRSVFHCVFDVQRDFYCLIRRARRSKRHGVMDVAVITVSNMELNALLGIW